MKSVLFVCKLNPVTLEHDLELIFSRFGKIKSCEIVRDWKTGDSLQYAFVDFETEESCVQAYLKMNGALIDERRIHVDFSQSVAKQWNAHRKKQLRDAAQSILKEQQDQREKQRNLLFPYLKEEKNEGEASRERRESSKERDHRRRSRSREDYRRRKYDHDSRRHRRRSRSRSYERRYRDDRRDRRR